ncbi:MAG: serine/threonine-protein kinase [Kofleriaceae bacterium]
MIGQTFDNKFRIIRLIGRGGMGEVFEAEHTQLGKRVAVKLMLEKYNGDREAIARFTREALAAGRIGDPHIIDVMDIGTAPDGRAYVVMELLTGQPLSRLIEDHGQLPLNRAIKIMRQVLRAVGAAHTKGIVHRDLKPDNIFLTTQGDQQDFVKLLDFGISKIVDPEAVAATKLTTTGVVMGTPLYMAPEQAMGNEVDHFADLYACGVIFYEMIAGKPPFEGHTYAVLVAKLLTTDAPLLSDLREGVPPRLVAAIHKALEKEPKARHAHADAFLLALPATQSGSPVELAGTVASGPQAVAVQTPSSKRNLVIGVAAALAGVAVASVILMKLQSSPSPAPSPEPTKTVETTPIAPTRIDFVVSPPEAVVTLDNDPAHTYRNGQGIVVTPGKHELKVELAGYLTQTRTVTLAEGQTDKQSFALIPEKPVVADTEASPPDKKDPKKKGPKTELKTAVKTPEVKTTKTVDRTPDKMVDSTDGYTPPAPIKKDPPVKKEPVTSGPDRKPNPY